MPTRPLTLRYEDDLALFPSRWHRIGLVVFAVFLLALPLTADAFWLNVANLSLVTVVGAVGLMILTGFTGQISLGHAAFLAVGAYAAAVLGGRGWPFWLVLPTAGAAAAAVGLAVGPFALRLKGLYLAIVTIGLLFLVNHLLLSFPEITRGVSGIAVPMHTWFGGIASGPLTSFTEPLALGPVTLAFGEKLYFVFLALAAGAVWVGKNVQRSNTGRAFMAVRDRDLAAAALGVNVAGAKIVSFGLSSFLGGVAGAMFAFQQQYVTVDPPFNLAMSVEYIAMIVLGGMGTTFGAVAGAVFFTVVTPVAQTVGREVPLLANLSSAQQSTLLFAVVVIAFLIFEPLGLLGIWLRVKRYFQSWPFRY